MIKTVVTRGYGNGTYSGTIALVVTRGYAIGDEGAEPTPATSGWAYCAFAGNKGHLAFEDNKGHVAFDSQL